MIIDGVRQYYNLLDDKPDLVKATDEVIKAAGELEKLLRGKRGNGDIKWLPDLDPKVAELLYWLALAADHQDDDLEEILEVWLMERIRLKISEPPLGLA